MTTPTNHDATQNVAQRIASESSALHNDAVEAFRRGVVEKCRKVALEYETDAAATQNYERGASLGRAAEAINALADELEQADSVKAKTAPSHSTVVDQSHLQLDAARLREVLGNLAFSYDDRDKGDPCWCSTRYEETYYERTGAHEATCQAARAAYANSITQPSASASELSATLPDHSPASLTEMFTACNGIPCTMPTHNHSALPEPQRRTGEAEYCVGGYGWDDAHIIDSQGNKVIVVYRNPVTNESPSILANEIVNALNTPLAPVEGKQNEQS